LKKFTRGLKKEIIQRKLWLNTGASFVKEIEEDAARNWRVANLSSHNELEQLIMFFHFKVQDSRQDRKKELKDPIRFIDPSINPIPFFGRRRCIYQS
jgi:hypothetical protein